MWMAHRWQIRSLRWMDECVDKWWDGEREEASLVRLWTRCVYRCVHFFCSRQRWWWGGLCPRLECVEPVLLGNAFTLALFNGLTLYVNWLFCDVLGIHCVVVNCVCGSCHSSMALYVAVALSMSLQHLCVSFMAQWHFCRSFVWITMALIFSTLGQFM